MIKIMFVCHGNICRSPMAEFVMKNLVKNEGLEKAFYISSSATSREEIGNGVHYGTCKKLNEFHISCEGKHAIQLCRNDYLNYDYLIGMDNRNIVNMERILQVRDTNKIFRLLDLSDDPRDIADPWYTGNFDETYENVLEGCYALLSYLKENHEI